MPGRDLTREQALAWNPNWSHTDKQTIEEHMDRVNAVGFYRPPSGGYTRCRDANGKNVMFIHAGYVTFAKGLAPADRSNPDWDGIDLSTVRGKNPARARNSTREVFCPVHGTPVRAVVGCEDCG